MRLINIDTLQLDEFFGDRIPRYAILSHTWENEEISFQDYNWLQNYEEEEAEGIIDELPPKQRLRVRAKYQSLKKRSGYIKIQKFVELARGYRGRPVQLAHACWKGLVLNIEMDPVDYIWIDTCCINKESSAELSEAINSMYEWYAKAQFCIAYLGDVVDRKARRFHSAAGPAGARSFPGSRWFTRGWTLQELLVPKYLNFYNKYWEPIACKIEVLDIIKEVTGISRGILTDEYGLRSASVATKMSWAARRQTTRVEDEAYCLLGIFGVNMPLLYGEGTKAFQRLQHEILRISHDQSILMWGYNQPRLKKFQRIFAPSPSDFEGCAKAFSAYDDFPMLGNKPFFLTNIGLHISVNLFRHRYDETSPARSYAVLPVKDNRGWLLGIPLASLDHLDQLDDIEDGTAISRRGYDQPLALFSAKSIHMESLVLKTLIFLHSPSSRRNETKPTIRMDEFNIEIVHNNGIHLLEHWSDSFLVDVEEDRDQLRTAASLYGRSGVGSTINTPFYFRARVKNDLDRAPSLGEFVVKLVMDQESGNLREAGVWEWNSFRGPSLAPSMAALFLTGQGGGEAKGFRQVLVTVRKEVRTLSYSPRVDGGGLRFIVDIFSSGFQQ